MNIIHKGGGTAMLKKFATEDIELEFRRPNRF